MNNLHVTIEASDEEAVKRLCAKVKEILKKVEQVQKLELSRQTKKIAIQNTIFENLPELQFSDYETYHSTTKPHSMECVNCTRLWLVEQSH